MESEAESEVGSTSSELVSNRSDTWFPMHEGNTWALESASGEVRSITYEGVNEGIGHLTGLMVEGRWLGTASSTPNSLYSWNEVTNSWETFIRFGYAVTPWIWGDGACSTYKVKRSATNITVTTPAGTFSGARRILFELKPLPNVRCAAPAFTELTFAPNVGLIAIDTHAGKFLLTSAKVNGKAFPSNQIKGSLRLDKSTYINSPNTIACITTPCPSNEVTTTAKATYTVTNNGSASQTFEFNSGCQFDLQLVDDKGEMVRSLSEVRFCTLALTRFTLAAGQSKVFTAQIPLSNRVGEQLFGNFTAKAMLSPRNGASSAESAASFIVQKP